MHPSDRQKMCTQCDGRIPLEAEGCLYCGARQVMMEEPASLPQPIQESLTPLYPSPYSKGPSTMTYSDDKKFSGKKKYEGFKEVSPEKRFTTTLGAPTIAVSEEEQVSEEGEKGSFWALLMLSVAATLGTLGLLQLFFSDNGFLRLEWDSSYWFVYLLVALPLFFLGLKKAKKL